MNGIVLPKGLCGGISTGGLVSPRRASSKDAMTVALLHMDGVNNGTSFIDETGKTWTATGSQTRTAIQKFGTASMYNTANTNRIETPASTDFQFGTDPFTIDFWFYVNPLTGGRLFSQYEAANKLFYAEFSSGAAISFVALNPPTDVCYYQTSASGLWTQGTWNHFAFVRSGTNFYIFVNGQSKALNAVQAVGSTSFPYYNGNFQIGAQNSTNGMTNGYIDEFRVSKGIARWTSDFSVPTIPYP